MSKKYRTIPLLIFLLIFLLINSINNISQLNEKRKIVNEYQKELEKEKEKNKQLKEKITEIEDENFIERVAREKLGMGKPGESIVIIPEITVVPEKKKEKDLANWERWWKLFFNN